MQASHRRILVGMGNDDPEQVPDTPTAEVPDVVGFDAIDACALVRRAGLVPYGSGETPAPGTGVVMTQTPQAADVATVGAPVYLEVDPGNLAPD